MSDQTATLVDAVVKVLALSGGIVGFVVAYQRYTRTQQWKILEFVASKIKEFDRDPEVQKAKKMLDWWEYLVELFPYKEDESQRRVLVTDRIVMGALRTEGFEKRFEDKEVEIRNIFDTFFDYMDRFENYVESGLVEYEQLHPYLGYWLAMIVGQKEPDPRSAWRDAMKMFIEKYHSPGTSKLVNTYMEYARTNRLSVPDKLKFTTEGPFIDVKDGWGRYEEGLAGSNLPDGGQAK